MSPKNNRLAVSALVVVVGACNGASNRLADAFSLRRPASVLPSSRAVRRQTHSTATPAAPSRQTRSRPLWATPKPPPPDPPRMTRTRGRPNPARSASRSTFRTDPTAGDGPVALLRPGLRSFKRSDGSRACAARSGPGSNRRLECEGEGPGRSKVAGAGLPPQPPEQPLAPLRASPGERARLPSPGDVQRLAPRQQVGRDRR
jgi:hypothetical protein